MNITRHATKIGFAAIAAAIVISTGAASCDSGGGAPSGQQLETQQQSNDTTQYEQTMPIPSFNGQSQMRRTLTEVEAIQALGSQTTSFFFNQGIADPIFSCPSLGMPVASTAQLSNPQQIVDDGYPNGGASVVIGQMDPNGVYSPPDSTGTNVLCLDAHGNPYIQYWEGFVDAVSGAASWNASTHTVQVIGQPSIPTCSVQVIKHKSQTICTK